ncbi:MAG TPA: hypothetical protein PLN94_17180, partial [Thiolinea sp.]|nr:hypothetical protein [Thiolinea sp.]
MTDHSVNDAPNPEQPTNTMPENGTEKTAAQTETTRQESGQGAEPPHHSRCSWPDDAGRQWRWKRIGAVLLLLAGFFLGRISAHHHGAHDGWKHSRYERGGNTTEMRSGYPDSMSRILDGI